MEPLEDLEIEPAGGKSPESVFLDEETNRAIARIARSLNQRDREFLQMYYYDELPRDEIARLLGVREERLRLIKSRALKRFREIYEKLKAS
jgi:RNA polymerase sigma factor (sigma-70 family)